MSLPGYDDWLDNHGNPGITEPEECDNSHPWFCDEHGTWQGCMEECLGCSAHYSSGRCWCDEFHRDQPTTLLLVPPPIL